MLLLTTCTGPSEPSGRLCIQGRIIDPLTATARSSAMHIREGTVRSLSANCDDAEEDAEILDLSNRFILPGLVNAHAHVGSTNGLEYRAQFYTEENLRRQLALYARFGVTTVMSMGDDQQPGFDLRDRQRSRPPTVSRLLVAGPVPSPISPQDARRQTRRLAARRPDFIKVRVDDYFGRRAKAPWEITRATVEEALGLGFPVAAHVFYLEDAKRLMELGASVLTRSVRDREVDEEFIRLAREKEVCATPALSREWAEVEYAGQAGFLDDPLLKSSRSPSILESFRSPRWLKRYRESPWKDRYRDALETAKRNLRILSEQGVRIAMGSDSGFPGRFEGYFELLEMELMQESGLTAAEVMRAATSEAAACLGQGDRLGRLV